MSKNSLHKTLHDICWNWKVDGLLNIKIVDFNDDFKNMGSASVAREGWSDI